MAKRLANDAQVDRLLKALKDDLSYRQQVARRIAERDNIKYDSAMRRLQRYVTDAGQKRDIRSVAAAPYRKELRQEARQVERTYRPVRREPEPERYEPSRGSRYQFFDDEDSYDEEDEDEEEEGESESGGPGRPYDNYDIQSQDLLAIIAYHDGDTRETARELDLSPRAGGQLGMLLRSYEAGAPIDVMSSVDAVELEFAARDFMNALAGDDRSDIEAFHDALMSGEMADWRIGVIVRDIEAGRSTFDQWVDAYYHDAQYEDDLSEFWALWRAAYGRSKGK